MAEILLLNTNQSFSPSKSCKVVPDKNCKGIHSNHFQKDNHEKWKALPEHKKEMH
jgi:hypothetical protein